MNLFLRRNIIKKTFAFLILGVAGLLILNKAVFLHTHRLSDGTFVLHAHPFQSGSDTNHQHSNGGYLFFDQTSLLCAQIFDKLTLFQVGHYTTLFSEEIRFHLENYRFCLKDRAPPAISAM